MLPPWPKLFDRYDLCARITPGVMVVLPAVVALAVHVPILPPMSVSHIALYGAAAGFAWVLGTWVRGRGLHAQERLVAKWGGMPTELLLRHGDPRIDAATKARYHAALQAMTPHRRMPTAEEEAADPAAALQTYRSAVRRLIENRREAADNLVLAENASYGFWRNLHGCRLPALIVAVGSAIAVAGPDAIVMFQTGPQFTVPLHRSVLAMALVAWGALLWCVAGEQRVKDAAVCYAERLLGTLDRPEKRNASKPRKALVRPATIAQRHTPAE